MDGDTTATTGPAVTEDHLSTLRIHIGRRRIATLWTQSCWVVATTIEETGRY